MTSAELNDISEAVNAIKWRVEDMYFGGMPIKDAKKSALSDFVWINNSLKHKKYITNLIWEIDIRHFSKKRVKKMMADDYSDICKRIGKSDNPIGRWIWINLGFL